MRALQHAEDLMPTIEAKMVDLRTPPSQILSADGQVLYEDSEVYRDPVSIDQVPQVIQNAIVAAEDRRFFDHGGVDLISLGRVAFLGAKAGHFSQGGSTLTMQLAKRLSSTGQRTISRKLNDMALAYTFEQQWSKERILQLYLNEVYFGSGAYGIKAAAEVYFGKALKDITLPEAAMLARCVRRPSDENPFVNLDKAIANRNVVLEIMLEQGQISNSEYEKAIKAKVHLNHKTFHGSATVRAAPYFVEDVLEELRADHPDVHLADGGYTIYTTLDLRVQRAAENYLQEVLDKYSSKKVTTGAFVLLDSEGKIIAEVGGANYAKNQYNIATSGRRQPGSSFKPFVYATAFQQGKLTEDSMVSNEKIVYTDPVTHKSWIPKNDDHSYGGQVSVRNALAQSINLAAVHTLLDVGIDSVITNAHDAFGITSPLHRFPSLALGSSEVSPMEMAKAYSVFMLHGNRVTPYDINKINAPDGSTVFEGQPNIVTNVFDRSSIDQVDDLLRGVVTSGTGWKADVVPEARGKTGTTSDNKDAWFCGFASGYVGVGWVANEHFDHKRNLATISPMTSSAFGGTITAEWWADILNYAIKVRGDSNAPKLSSSDSSVDSSAGAKPADAQAADSLSNPGGSADSVQPGSTGSVNSTTGPSQTPDGPKGSKSTANSGVVMPSTVDQEKTQKANANDQTVTVTICVDSGDIATPYCPETITRTYKKGTEPTKRCPIHHG